MPARGQELSEPQGHSAVARPKPAPPAPKPPDAQAAPKPPAAEARAARRAAAPAAARGTGGARVATLATAHDAPMARELAQRQEEEEAAAAAAAEGREPSVVLEKGDNFYQLLQDAKDLLPDNQWWVQ